ncbi:MAG: GNAT family N-acetyltransferase [Hyphomicrobium sp.]
MQSSPSSCARTSRARGLGYTLMQHLVSYARAEGLAELSGDVLAANTTMLKLCHDLGFAAAMQDGADVFHVTLPLTAVG